MASMQWATRTSLSTTSSSTVTSQSVPLCQVSTQLGHPLPLATLVTALSGCRLSSSALAVMQSFWGLYLSSNTALNLH